MTRCPVLTARIAREIAAAAHQHAKSTQEKRRTYLRLRAATCALIKMEARA